MRYAKGVIIIGTSVLGGVLAGLSIAQMGGLAQFPYGIGMAVGIALLGMLIQFAINKDRDEEEESEDEDEPYEEERSRKRKNIPETETTISDMHRMIVEESPQVDIGMTGRGN